MVVGGLDVLMEVLGALKEVSAGVAELSVVGGGLDEWLVVEIS